MNGGRVPRGLRVETVSESTPQAWQMAYRLGPFWPRSHCTAQWPSVATPSCRSGGVLWTYVKEKQDSAAGGQKPRIPYARSSADPSRDPPRFGGYLPSEACSSERFSRLESALDALLTAFGRKSPADQLFERCRGGLPLFRLFVYLGHGFILPLQRDALHCFLSPCGSSIIPDCPEEGVRR